MVLTEIQDDMYRVIDELRELAHGIHPAELTDQGLAAAVRSRARRATTTWMSMCTPPRG
jgi:signal transduction histidine kinase